MSCKSVFCRGYEGVGGGDTRRGVKLRRSSTARIVQHTLYKMYLEEVEGLKTIQLPHRGFLHSRAQR